MSHVLEIENLEVLFHGLNGYVQAVSGVDFSVAEGETLGLVGESGSGKSVTAQAVMKLLPKRTKVSGSVRLEGEDLLQLSHRSIQQVRGRNISMIFQEPMSSLNPVLKIGEQIGDPLRMHRNLSKRELREQVIEIIHSVGIPRPSEIVDEYPHQLSGGMRQRVMIGIAIACSPKLLIADEPTTALDVTVQAQILDLLREFQAREGMGILLITHDLGVVAEMCQRVAVMYAGRIVEECDVETLFEKPQHPYTQGLLRAVPDIRSTGRKLVPIPGTVPSLSERASGCSFAARCPHVMDRCHLHPPELRAVEQGHRVRCWLTEGGHS